MTFSLNFNQLKIMKQTLISRAILREILGKSKYGKSYLYLGLDDSKFGPIIALCYIKDWPIWHLEDLLGEEIDYVLPQEEYRNYGKVIKYDYQRIELRARLLEILVNKGRSRLRKYRAFNENILEKENNIYVKAAKTKRNLELNLNELTLNEIS